MATEGGEYMSYAPSKRKVDEMELILHGDPTPDGLVSIECFDPHQSEPVSSEVDAGSKRWVAAL